MFLRTATKFVPAHRWTPLTAGASRLSHSAARVALPATSNSPTIVHRTFSVGSNGDNDKPPSTESPEHQKKPTFVHPLSQIVLEHLQTSHPGFLTQHGLDKNLHLRPDGTFTLTFADDKGKIFTLYDPAEKKHWLTVQKGAVVGRFLLQDNLKPAWHSDERSTPQKIQDGVDEMIRTLQKQPDPS